VRGVALAAVVLVSPWAAHAYRPFEQTDADVAAQRAWELELGPVGVASQAQQRWFSPDFVVNYGVAPRFELVLDGAAVLPLASPSVATNLDLALLLKAVVRRGALQDEDGPSVALEGGALLPSVGLRSGIGASLACIVSERWTFATVHVNAELQLTREHQLGAVVGAIAEGPWAWTVRPVAEVLVESVELALARTAVLAGLVWRLSEHLSVDASARATWLGGAPILEGRAGLTVDVGG
jgi:hypothetical protein